jgi:Tfp pilus assembly protein PilO
LREEIALKKERLQALNFATATIGDLREEIEELEEAIVFFRSKLPDQEEMDQVLQEVWRMAEASDLTTRGIRTESRRTNKHPPPVPGAHAEQLIRLELEGDYLGFYRFLLAMESQPRIMRVRNMKLTKPKKGPEGRMEAEFLMSIFFEQPGKDSSG